MSCLINISEQLSIPVLFIVFNRPDYTEMVFNQIRKVRPRLLYIASDGPRSSEERDVVFGIRESLFSSIDWDCCVKTLYRENNLGCGKAVSGAIDWLFENEECGIILEDDCLPSLDFFVFCEKMLQLHDGDENIMMISGTNFLGSRRITLEQEYFYSKNFTIWGWATWRRAWRKYSFNISDNLHDQEINKIKDFLLRKYYIYVIDLVRRGVVDTWDYQWLYCCLINNGLSIVPIENLISNIGIVGAHSIGFESANHKIPIGRLHLAGLNEKKSIKVEARYDKILYKRIYVFISRIYISRLLKKLRIFKLYKLIFR